MSTLPLHPLVVHFPVVLAVLAPLVALVPVIRLTRGKDAVLGTRIVAGLFVALAVSAFVAVQTGELDEDAALAVTGEGPLERHEEAAERLMLLSLLGAGLAGSAAIAGSVKAAARARLPLAVVTLIAGGVVAWGAVTTGHTGGELVYVHGAASAHVRSNSDGLRAPIAAPPRDHDDD